jgi:hypothetical protein
MAHPYDRPRDPEDRREPPSRGLERGWRRLSEGGRHPFDGDRRSAYGDPHRAGGMFGGEDRSGALFSHGEGPVGPLRRPRDGPHRGKGPRGYVRSDARILEDVSDRLADDGRLDASDIEVVVAAGEVTLNGVVQSRHDKRRAEDLAEQASGVKQLQNNLRVRPEAVAAQPREAMAAPGAPVDPNRPAARPPLH